MPEIKNTFTQGKMNKDLDERLVPNGQYRDAMNVQLSTSDGSDVGALENILGNDILMGGTELGDSSYCVGKIADKKIDTLYWLVADTLNGASKLAQNLASIISNVSLPDDYITKDLILKYTGGTVTPVLVDVYEVKTMLDNNGSSLWPDEIYTVNASVNIVVGSFCKFFDSSGNFIIERRVTSVKSSSLGLPGYEIEFARELATFINSFTITQNAALLFTNPRVLNFQAKNIITGINILDEFLLFTDNNSEPKKINIPRCESGTVDLNTHTNLIVPQTNITLLDNVYLKEEHITVIKKSPKTLLLTKPYFDIPTEAEARIDFTDPSTGDLFQNGDSIDICLTYTVGGRDLGNPYVLEDEVRFLRPGSSQSLPEDFEVIGKIETIGPPSPSGPNACFNFTVRIDSIASSIPKETKTFLIMRSRVEDVLFERKFPRFSYRWKYVDGEYSTYAPFTDVIFEPGLFKYDVRDGYNKGMQSSLTAIEFRKFLSKSTPKDVVQVDILYKESNSPLVYTVDKIKYSDDGTITTTDPNGNIIPLQNSWTANLYNLTSDLIYAVVPSNQLLRPWDNVPRIALGQEITGNRVVYGNYLQNYDLPNKPTLISGYVSRYDRHLNSNKMFKLDINFEGNDTNQPFLIRNFFAYNTPYIGSRSLKSSRKYQIGVTFSDEYGRETPVFSNTESTFNLSNKRSSIKSKIKTKITSAPPIWANYFKFYVKETANEYYNLAMDRWYEAEDDCIWLSFPSAERNKVDEETFLILKKQSDTNAYVEEKAKYKIIAIQNEAPGFIKSRTTLAGSSSGLNTPTLLSTSQPIIDQRFFEIDEDTWVNNGGAKLSEINDKLTLDFKANNVYSKKYEIISLNVYPDQGVNGGSIYRIVLDRPIDTKDKDLIYPRSSSNPSLLVNLLPDFASNLSLRVYKTKITNDPEFEGKFFVKINSDGTTDRYITNTNQGDDEYEILSRINSYFLLDADIGGGGATNFYGNNASGGDTTGVNKSDTAAKWEDNLDFNDPQDGDEDSEWFIDQAYFDSGYPAVSTPVGGGSAVGASMNPNFPGGWGQGIHKISGQWYIELAFSSIQPRIGGSEIPFEDIPGGKKKTYSDFNENYIWDVGKLTNPEHAAESAIVDQLVEGSKFKFSGDTNNIIYTISGPVQLERRINHTGWKQVEDAWQQWNTANFYLNSNWDNATYVGYRNKWRDFGRANNRRVTWIIPVDLDPTTSSSFNPAGEAWGVNEGADDSTAIGIEFVKPRGETSTTISLSSNPAVWETEPKESIDLDIYHEASQAFPTVLDGTNNEDYAPIGSWLSCPTFERVLTHFWQGTLNIIPNAPTILVRWEGDDVIVLDHSLSWVPHQNLILNPSGQVVNLLPNTPIRFNKSDGSYVTLKLASLSQLNTPDPTTLELVLDPTTNFTTSLASFYNEETKYKIKKDVSNNEVSLSWFNCFSFNNGVESNRIRDIFNEVTIDKGPKVSAPLEEPYEEERRGSGLIYSGIYNTNSGINNLNQFIQAEKITKDLNPTYGSIQKLFSRTGDLVSFCEDKVVRIVANKDALFNADGNPQLIATNRVLGQSLPFSGDYGISKNPESFVNDGFRAYFTDKQRSAVLRLSKDGLTNISDYGMGDWFGDRFKQYSKLIGTYDDNKNNYNLSLVEPYSAYEGEKTLTYNENVKGWVSFKSFIPEQGLSMNNDYYTFKGGYIYVHHQTYVDRNTFYGDFNESTVDVLLNSEPSSIKNYQTLNYEGTKSKITIEALPLGINSNEYEGYNKLIVDKGWYVETIDTDSINKQSGHINEFIEKEGKWFNYIKGKTVQNNLDIKTSEFSFQGIGRASSVPPPVLGCTDTNALNYNPLANLDDGSCTYPVSGCTNQLANNYDPAAVIDDGSCTFDDSYNCDTVNGGVTLITNGTGLYIGPTAYADAIAACPSCIGAAGCTDSLASNYDPLAVCDDGSCIPCVDGCLDNSLGFPYFPDINGDCYTPSIVPGSSGLCDPGDGYVMFNYDPSVTCDDGSCISAVGGCTDPLANNQNLLANYDDGSCQYCSGPTCCRCGDNNSTTSNPDVYGDCLDGTNVGYPNVGGCGAGNGYYTENYDPLCNSCSSGCTPACLYGCTDPNAFNYFPGAQFDDGSCLYMGCMDSTALNYDPFATTSLGNCCGPSFTPTLMGCNDCTQLNYDSLIQPLCGDPTACVPPIIPTISLSIYNNLSSGLWRESNLVASYDDSGWLFNLSSITTEPSVSLSVIEYIPNNPAYNTQIMYNHLHNPATSGMSHIWELINALNGRRIYHCQSNGQILDYFTTATVSGGPLQPYSSNPGNGTFSFTLTTSATQYNGNTNPTCTVPDITMNATLAIVYGCMHSSNANYNASANVHVCSMCA